MTPREQRLEATLRRIVVRHMVDDLSHCGICAGTWEVTATERHTRSCVLYREGHEVLPEPPEIPF